MKQSRARASAGAGAQLKDVSIPAERMYFDTARAPGAEVAAPEPPLPASRPARRPLPPQDLCRLRAPQACWDGGELRDAKAKSRATEDRLEALLSEAYESDARAAQADAGASVLERAQIARDQLLRVLKPTSAFTLRCTPPLRSKTLQPEMSGKVDCRSCRAIA